MCVGGGGVSAKVQCIYIDDKLIMLIMFRVLFEPLVFDD